MELKEVKELIEAINSSSITEFQLEKENFKIFIKKEAEKIILKEDSRASHEAVSEVYEEVTEKREEALEDKKPQENVHIIKSPIVGTFYASPSPDAEAYVKPGERVRKGDVLCIIEAMKLMNEVTSEVDGEIAEVLAGNLDLVEYGQPLFSIRKV